MILVVGGTGNIGKELVRGLVASGQKVRLLMRSSDSSMAPEGVETVVGDLSDRASLDAALAGIDKAFLVSSPDPDAVALQNNFIDACAAAGISQLVKSSVYAADEPTNSRFMQAHHEIEKYLVASGVPFTLLRPNLFHQTTLASLGAIKQGVLPQPQGDGAVSSVDARDIAAVGVVVLTEDGHLGKAYELTGPEALTSQQCANAISEAAGYTVAYIDVDPEEYTKTMLGYGLSEFMAVGLTELFDYYKQGRAARICGDVELVTGNAPIPFSTWLAENAGAFAK